MQPHRIASALLVLTLGLARVGSNARADEPTHVEFEHLWRRAQATSPTLQAARHETSAARIGQTRAGRHWYPRVYADARIFATNDPAMNFMAVLGQREIGTADFAPDALNTPGSNLFQRGTLGLDLPLYEGGMRTSMATVAAKGAEARSWESQSAQANEFTSLARDYAGLLALEEERTQLGALREQVAGVIASYEIGSRENPVGYSGLLGLKSLTNRVNGLLAANAARAAELRARIETSAGSLPAEWKPVEERPRAFLNRVLPTPQPVSEAVPAAVRAAQSAAEAQEASKGAERARFLPKVAVFAQGDLYGGDRAIDGSYTAGAYLNWELFSAPNLGAEAQASASAAAARERARGLGRQLENQHRAAQTAVESLVQSLTLLDQSAELLDEQTATARTLFRNGSINALQLVEVLSRRADLLSDRAQAELSLAEAKAALVFTAAVPPTYDPEGVAND